MYAVVLFDEYWSSITKIFNWYYIMVMQAEITRDVMVM